ncbi:MAG: SUMF1/EgtB/PvdO family nonheme iron enzyme [Flavobacteriales bacterium]|nr:MAG: SUMF1/EgtB/PvdO family nonheme iron enzyme [Flavobacteriales bacterium]
MAQILHFLLRTLLIATLLTCQGPTSLANNIQITNASLTNNNGTFAFIQFDLSWENSWRGGGLANWDAAWVFVKYRDVNNVWHHVNLAPNGHVIPAGSGAALSTAPVNVNTPYDPVTNPNVGVFIHRGIPGSGTFSLTGVQLKWNYAAEGIAYADVDDVGVFGIEMVYVPEGPFIVGQNATYARFQRTYINTADASVVPTGNGGPLSSPQGGHAIGEDQPPSDRPNGYRGFYCMKYELSQQTYADYLNTLTLSEQVLRTTPPFTPPSTPVPYMPTGTPVVSATARNGLVVAVPSTGFAPAQFGCDLNGNDVVGEADDGGDIPMNWVSGKDYMAFLDWSGLRPLSDMEFEKVCRGPNLPVINEYAWGNTAIMTTPYLLSGPGTATEGIGLGYQTTLGNANHAGTSTAYDGPVRSGCFAANPANNGRMTAGVSYYGAMEMSGNLAELIGDVHVPSSNSNYSYTYSLHGNGSLDAAAEADAFNVEWGAPSGLGARGGHFASVVESLQVSRNTTGTPGSDPRLEWAGIRGARSAP